jgi:hypothetical protein
MATKPIDKRRPPTWTTIDVAAVRGSASEPMHCSTPTVLPPGCVLGVRHGHRKLVITVETDADVTGCPGCGCSQSGTVAVSIRR